MCYLTSIIIFQVTCSCFTAVLWSFYLSRLRRAAKACLSFRICSVRDRQTLVLKAFEAEANVQSYLRRPRPTLSWRVWHGDGEIASSSCFLSNAAHSGCCISTAYCIGSRWLSSMTKSNGAAMQCSKRAAMACMGVEQWSEVAGSRHHRSAYQNAALPRSQVQDRASFRCVHVA